MPGDDKVGVEDKFIGLGVIEGFDEILPIQVVALPHLSI